MRLQKAPKGSTSIVCILAMRLHKAPTGRELQFICINLEFVVYSCFNPLPSDKVLDWAKLKQIADDILKCIEPFPKQALVMDLIGQELFELFALELENLPYLTLFTL